MDIYKKNMVFQGANCCIDKGLATKRQFTYRVFTITANTFLFKQLIFSIYYRLEVIYKTINFKTYQHFI